VEVGELRPLRERARLLEEADRRAHLADVGPRPGLARERAHLELDGAGGDDGGARLRVLGDGGLEVAPLGPGLRAREDRLGAGALVARDAAREERGVDAEPRGEPADRLRRRPRLAALDLGDVLLREAVAGEVGLREPGGDAERAQAVAEAGAACG